MRRKCKYRRATLYWLSAALLIVLVHSQTEGESQEIGDDVNINVDALPYSLSFSVEDPDYDIINVTCRTGSSSTEIVANEEHVCEGLTPCTVYTCVVTLQLIGTEQQYDRTIETSTDYKQPSTTITSVTATTSTITILWDTEDRSCVKSFDIVARSTEKTDSYATETNTRDYYTFRDLNSCLQHNITLSTTDIQSQIVDTDVTDKYTDYNEPGDVELTITNLANGHTQITWNEPTNRTCIGNYTLKWRLMDCATEEDVSSTETLPTATTDIDYTTDTTWARTFEATWDTTWDTTWEPTTGTTTTQSDIPEEEDEVVCNWQEFSNDVSLKQFTLTDLLGCDLYTFEVFINDNETAKASEEFFSAEKLPSGVRGEEKLINSTAVTWTWEQPVDHYKCIAQYDISLTGPLQRTEYTTVVKSTMELSVTFDGLDPCGDYRVEIIPISNNGTAGTIFQTQLTLNKDNPSKIENPVATVTSSIITIMWDKPTYADLCIENYRIAGWTIDSSPVDALSREVTVPQTVFDTGLSACQAYYIQIIASTIDMDSEPEDIEVEMKPAVVDSDKIEFQSIGFNSHSLELNARNQDNSNSCKTIYALFNCSTTVEVPHMYAEKYVESHTQGNGFETALSPLSPNTQYTCEVLLYNVAGASNYKRLVKATGEYFPEQPTDVKLESKSNNSLTFSWSPPIYPNGQIRLYYVYLMRYEADYFVPVQCAAIVEEPHATTLNTASYTFTNLAAAIKYSIQVAASNDYGIGQYTATQINVTLPTISDPVTNLSVSPEGPDPSESEYSANVTVTWTMPCKSNGQISEYLVQFNGQHDTNAAMSFTRSVAPVENSDGRMTYTETDLRPEYVYTVQVAVRTVDVESASTSVAKKFESPAGIPARLNDDVVSQMRVNAFETNRPTSTAVVRLPKAILNSDSGTIRYIALLLSEKNCYGEPQLQHDALDTLSNWPNMFTWQQAGADGSRDCIEQYQTTPRRWQPETSISGTDQEEIVFTIGADDCQTTLNYYCNGPLQANTEYNLVVRLFTKSGYNDAALLEFKTDAAIKVTLILISVCCCLLMAFVIGLMVLYVRKRIAWQRESSEGGIEDSFGNVTGKKFAIFYDKVAKPEKLAHEFKEITFAALELSCAASELGSEKNRYADIYPYDKNRVILDIDSEGSDYINASFIDGHSRKKEYIATQGPKPESVMDFWRMVMQHNVRIIVQVTQFREGNTIKCHEYFPCNMRNLSVKIKSKESFELYDRTEMTVLYEKHGLKQKVVHFFFKKWPDHGCPEDPLQLITFVRKVKAEKRPSYSPIVVHCSAGVGRTGTFIGLDLIMQRLKSDSKINIFNTVKKLRFQRMKMVQTQEQYTFLYACTYELVKHKISRVTADCRGKKTELKPKKVSFPDVEMNVGDADKAGSAGNDVVPTLQLPTRLGGMRRSKEQLDAVPKNNGYVVETVSAI